MSPFGSSTKRRTNSPQLSTTYLVPTGRRFGSSVLGCTFLNSGFLVAPQIATKGYSVTGLRRTLSCPHSRDTASVRPAAGMSAFGGKADIPRCTAHVRLSTQSGHRLVSCPTPFRVLSRVGTMPSAEPWLRHFGWGQIASSCGSALHFSNGD